MSGQPWLVEPGALEAWLEERRSRTRRFVEEYPGGWRNGMWDPETGQARHTD